MRLEGSGLNRKKNKWLVCIPCFAKQLHPKCPQHPPNHGWVAIYIWLFRTFVVQVDLIYDGAVDGSNVHQRYHLRVYTSRYACKLDNQDRMLLACMTEFCHSACVLPQA